MKIHLLLIFLLSLFILMSCRSKESNTMKQDESMLISARQAIKDGNPDKAAELFAEIYINGDVIPAEKFSREFLDEDFPTLPESIFTGKTLDGKQLEPFHMIFTDRKLFGKCWNALDKKLISEEQSEQDKITILNKDFVTSKSDALRFIAKTWQFRFHKKNAPCEELQFLFDDTNPAITCFLFGMASYLMHDTEPFETGFKKTLREFLDNKNEFVRLTAAKLLAERSDESSEETLISLLQNPYLEVRRIAQEGLGYNLQTEKSIKALEQALQIETNQRYRDGIQRKIDTAKKGIKTGHSSIHYGLMNSE